MNKRQNSNIWDWKKTFDSIYRTGNSSLRWVKYPNGRKQLLKEKDDGTWSSAETEQEMETSLIEDNEIKQIKIISQEDRDNFLNPSNKVYNIITNKTGANSKEKLSWVKRNVNKLFKDKSIKYGKRINAKAKKYDSIYKQLKKMRSFKSNRITKKFIKNLFTPRNIMKMVSNTMKMDDVIDALAEILLM